MKTRLYQNVMLTIIAVCLIILTLNNRGILKDSNQEKHKTVGVEIRGVRINPLRAPTPNISALPVYVDR